MDKAPPKEEVVEIDCADLIVRPDNRALDETMVAEIAESFERSSQATPMLVRRLMDNKYEIIDGQHRFAAKRLAAIRYPYNPAHCTASCIVRELTDIEAEIQMLVANIQKPISVADKGRLYERIGVRIDDQRNQDSSAFANMDRGQAIAAVASSSGVSVSKATVYRSINEAHAEDGSHEYTGMDKRQRKSVSRMRTSQRKEAARVLSNEGSEGLDAWLARVAEETDRGSLDTCLRRIRSAASEIRRLERRGIALDGKTASILDAIEAD